MSKRNGLAVACLSALCAVAAPAAGAQSRVAVRVYDFGFSPYTAWGTADASGSVIVFDPDTAGLAPPRSPRGGSEAEFLPPYQAAPMAPFPPPLETSAGPAEAEPEQPAEAAQSGGDGAATTQQGAYVDGVYLVNTDYLLSYVENTYRVLTGPLRFERDDWINVALVAGIGGALLLLDEPLIDFWQGDVRGDATESLADGFREFGESDNIVIASLGAYALAEALDTSEAFDLKREKATALLTLQSFLLTQGFITGIKYVTGRERPEDTDDAFDFQGPSKGDFNASFPSGHAGSAFAVASVISQMYGDDNPWVPWFAYSIATGTALSRVDDNRHWFSDVFVGGAMGYFIGRTVTRYNPFLQRNNITLLPFSRDGARGVAVSYRF